MTWILLAATQAQPEMSLFYAHEEEQAVGLLVGDIRTDAHASLAAEFSAGELQTSFHFLTPRPPTLVINETTGIIRTASRLDREALCPSAAYCAIHAEVAAQYNFKVSYLMSLNNYIDYNI